MKFGFTPPADMLSKITDEDIVEVYSEDHTQLFRNFEFFSVSSRTLEELFCLEWWTLFQRDDVHSMKMLAMATQIFAGAAPEGFSHAVPEHSIAEALSQDKYRVNYHMQHFIPLYGNKRVEALVSVPKGRILP